MQLTVTTVPGLRTFFRHCPSCGRRFEIRLVSKEEVEATEHNEERAGLPGITTPPMTVVARWGGVPRPLLVHDASPITVDMEEFQYTYECKHCGHRWNEVREKTEVGHKPESYTGD